MDDLAVARALHVLAVVHWIGGVSLVTLVLLPGIIRNVPLAERLPLFEMIEGRFAWQARFSTVVAGTTGFYMTHEMAAWDRFLEPSMWWMHLMLVVWAVFTFVLFAAEPLFLNRWFRDRALHDPDDTFRIVLRMHMILLTASLLAVAGAVLGAHVGLP